MTASILAYRLFRLRRLIAAAILLPALVVLLIAAAKGAAAFWLLPLAVGLPLAHALRYPTAWLETASVSLVVAALLALAGTIGPDVGLLGLALRIAGLGVLGFVLFMVAVATVPMILGLGEAKPVTAHARRWTKLSPQEAKARITLYPGRRDEKVTCGPRDEEGMFEIVIHHRMADCTEGGDHAFDVHLYATVLETGPYHHEIMSIEAQPEPEDIADRLEALDPETRASIEEAIAEARAQAEAAPERSVSVSRHQFTPARGGTLVEVAERGVAMTAGMRLGFWLQDYFADHLTDELDRAEGRPPRANRFEGQSQMIVDIAKRFAPQGATPAE